MRDILKSSELVFEKDENASLIEFIEYMKKLLEFHGEDSSIEFCHALSGVVIKIY